MPSLRKVSACHLVSCIMESQKIKLTPKISSASENNATSKCICH